MSYFWLAAGIIGQFMTLPAWGRFSDRFGNKALLSFTGLLVAFLPMLYLCGATWPFLVTVNFFGGVVWAGLGLGLNNYVLLLHSRRIAQRQLSFQVLSTPSDGPLERSLEAA